MMNILYIQQGEKSMRNYSLIITKTYNYEKTIKTSRGH